jgi:hypothetical protein
MHCNIWSWKNHITILFLSSILFLSPCVHAGPLLKLGIHPYLSSMELAR